MDSKRNERRKRALQRLEKQVKEEIGDLNNRIEERRNVRKGDENFLDNRIKERESSINKKNKEIGILKSRIL